ADGKVVAWGANDVGQTSVPPNLSNVVAIACSGDSCLALVGSGAIPPALVLGRPSLTSTTATLTATTALGRGYYVEFANSMPATNWTMLPPVAGDGTVKTFLDASGLQSWRFY